MGHHRVANVKEMWVEYKGRESIVERFDVEDQTWVRELWPEKEIRSHAILWNDAGYTILDREVHWTPDA